MTASAAIWWRVGPALAATGRRVVAVDLPGHGRTGHWTGRQRFRETAADLAAFDPRRPGSTEPTLQVIGHSWGAMVAAALPVAGLRPGHARAAGPAGHPRDAIIGAMADDPSRGGLPASIAEAVAGDRGARTRLDRAAMSGPRRRR